MISKMDSRLAPGTPMISFLHNACRADPGCLTKLQKLAHEHAATPNNSSLFRMGRISTEKGQPGLKSPPAELP